jgi:hypothetical protein
MSFFVISVPHQVRDKLQRESSKNMQFWTPAFAGVTALMTFLRSRQKFFGTKSVSGTFNKVEGKKHEMQACKKNDLPVHR